jgi:P27 family predicted phage terminase small subunit
MQDVLNQLENNGILEQVDKAALNMLARNYSMFIKASKELEESAMIVPNSKGTLVANPLIKIIKDSQVQAMNVMKEFGLTAKSRTKLPKLDGKEDDSPFEKFVKEGKEIRKAD